ncbi:MAG TPA: hypothetical protein VGE85_04655 [Terracidiphilus sp.]
MTTIAGLKLRDGVLLAADTEISEGVAKYAESKIFAEQISPTVSLAFAYSGTKDFATMAIQQIFSVVRSSNLDTHPAIQVAVKDTIDEVYTNSIGRLPEYSQSDNFFSLLIAVWAEKIPRLLITDQTAVVEESQFRCFGMGKALAKYLLTPVYYSEAKNIAHSTAEMAALRMLDHAKENAGGTGKESELVFLSSEGKIEKKNEGDFKPELKLLDSYDGIMGLIFPFATDLDTTEEELDAIFKFALDLHKRTLLEARAERFTKKMRNDPRWSC